MKSANPLLALVGACTAVSASSSSRLGNLPRGIHTSDAYDISTTAAARRNCDGNLHCAAISYRNESGRATFHTHAFVPGFVDGRSNATSMEGGDDAAWATYLSDKEFVFHPGRMVVDPRDVLKFEADSAMSLPEAREYCRHHEECVGFSFPTRHSRLQGFANITFASSFSSMEDDDEQDEWRTFVANDLGKSARISDAASLPFVEQFDERPHRSCCQRAPRDETTGEPLTLPSLAEVQSADTLPRIPCSISKEKFQARYELTRTPVMLVGCDDHWPAKERWARDALLERFDNATEWRSETHRTDGLEENSWGDIADDIVSGDSFYIFDQLDHEAGKSIEGDYETPPQFRGSDLYPSEYPNNYGSRRWWCVGTKGTGTKPHMDPLRTDAWNSVVHGHKWWVLYPPTVEKEESVVCDDDCSVDDPSPLDWYTSVAANALRTAVDGNGATPMHVLQSPGETIYVPNGSVHSVLNLDDTAAITANYGSPGNVQMVWREMLEDGDERLYKRLYYATFDADQRREVREGEFWPPEEWLGVREEGDDDEEEGVDEEDGEDDLESKDIASLEAEEKVLHKLLKVYEKDFVRRNERPVLSLKDVRPVASQYKRYEAIKEAIALKLA